MQSSQQHRKAQASHYQPTVGNQACKRKKKKNFRYGTASFTLSFFFLVGGGGTRDGNGEFSKTGNQDAGWEKVKKMCSENVEK